MYLNSRNSEPSKELLPNEGWSGEFIEIGFHNTSRLHCDVEQFGMLLDKKVALENTCKLM